MPDSRSGGEQLDDVALGGADTSSRPHDNDVATAASAFSGRAEKSADFSAIYRRQLLLALALLCWGVSACFNPHHIGVPVDVENHVPLVDVVPAATLKPIPAAVSVDGGAQACAPTEFNFIDVFDADGDTLTVRWDIVVLRGTADRQREVRQELKTSPPIRPLDDGSYAVNDSTDLTLDFEQLFGVGVNVEEQLNSTDPGNFQLVELRVSDNGFGRDANNQPVPEAGGAMFFKSWNVKLEPCAAVAP